MFVEETRPVDWIIIVIEVLVLVLIAYEVGHDVLDRRILAKRRRVVMNILDAGVELQNQIRQAFPVDEDKVQPWLQAVIDWTNQSNEQLGKLSQRASYSFAHIASLKSVSYLAIPSSAQDAYGRLVWRLEKLHKMMENPSAYF